MGITYLHETNLAVVENCLFLKVLRSEGVQGVVLGCASDGYFAENVVACMVRLWYLATGRVSRVK